MKICLKTYAKQDEQHRVVIKLQERLPERISHPCEVTCSFQVKKYDNYYLLSLSIAGDLEVTCQRCLHPFQESYGRQSELAICFNDVVAESLMEQYECVVAEKDQINLTDIVADDLYLFSPEKHYNSTDCSNEVNQWIGCAAS